VVDGVKGNREIEKAKAFDILFRGIISHVCCLILIKYQYQYIYPCTRLVACLRKMDKWSKNFDESPHRIRIESSILLHAVIDDGHFTVFFLNSEREQRPYPDELEVDTAIFF